MLRNAWIIPALPFLSFWLILFFGKRLPKKGSELGIPAVAGSFVLSVVLAVQWAQRVEDAMGAGEGGHGALGFVGSIGRSMFGPMLGAEEGHAAVVVEPVTRTWTWWQSGGITFGIGTNVDGLVAMMFLVVTIVSLLVHVYSTAYMHDDRRYTYYYAALSLFTASMLFMVVAENTLQLMVGWELVGLCSFMLIGHWWEEYPNARAGMKAFFTTRTGDIGLLLGVIVVFFGAGTFAINAINEEALAGGISQTAMLWGSILLFIGVIGKSGQFPLHTWLPDAMAGPSPVSALIHAATMVVAGVFLVARLYPVFWEGFDIELGGFNPLVVIGGITIVIAALLAFVQTDIKKVLAYSTVSQLGYMVMALGAGAWTAAVFHLFTHAFFKALLFLAAGSISLSATHHSFDMNKDMGGLRKYMPITFWTFIVGSVALAGIFPFAGFWSKDEILLGASQNDYTFFLYVGLLGAFLTAAYMTRCVYLTFFGEYRGHGHPHESPPAITVPLIILAVLSATAGLSNAVPFRIEKFKEYVEPLIWFPGVEHHDFSVAKAVISVTVALLGFALSWAYMTGRIPALRDLTRRLPAAHAGYTFLVNKYYLDDLYEKVVVAGISGPVARLANWINQNVIDAVVNGAGRETVRAGRFAYRKIDQPVIDGIVNGAGAVAEGSGQGLRGLQTGRVQQYGLLLFGAAAVFALIFVLVI